MIKLKIWYWKSGPRRRESKPTLLMFSVFFALLYASELAHATSLQSVSGQSIRACAQGFNNGNRYLKDSLKKFNVEYSSLESLVDFSICSFNLKDYQGAVNGFSRLINENHHFPLSYSYRARSYMAIGRSEEAIMDFKHAITKRLAGNDDYRHLAMIYSNMGDHDQGIAVLEEALHAIKARPGPQPSSPQVGAYSPSEERLIISLSDLYQLTSRRQKRVDLLRQGFERNNLSLELFDRLISALYESRNMREASKYTEKYCANPIIKKSKHCKKIQ